MAIWRSFFDPDPQAVHGGGQGLTLAQMARACLYLAASSASITLRLKLLDHARSNLLTLDDLSLALASWTSLNMIGVVRAAASTVRADNLTIVL